MVRSKFLTASTSGTDADVVSSQQGRAAGRHLLPILSASVVSRTPAGKNGTSSRKSKSTKRSASQNFPSNQSSLQQSDRRPEKDKQNPKRQPENADSYLHNTPSDEMKRFPCPYYTRYPPRFQACCGMLKAEKNLRHLKDHVQQKHQAHVCVICHEHFTNAADLNEHGQDLRCTAGGPRDYLKGCDKTQLTQLRDTKSRSSKFKDAKTPIETWNIIYQIVFPDFDEIPDPFFNPEVRDFLLFLNLHPRRQSNMEGPWNEMTSLQLDLPPPGEHYRRWRETRPSTHWRPDPAEISRPQDWPAAQLSNFVGNPECGIARSSAIEQDTLENNHNYLGAPSLVLPRIKEPYYAQSPDISVRHNQSYVSHGEFQPSDVSSSEIQAGISTDPTSITVDHLHGLPASVYTDDDLMQYGDDSCLHSDQDTHSNAAPWDFQADQLVHTGNHLNPGSLEPRSYVPRRVSDHEYWVDPSSDRFGLSGPG